MQPWVEGSVSAGDQISETREQPSRWRSCVFNMEVDPFVKQIA